MRVLVELKGTRFPSHRHAPDHGRRDLRVRCNAATSKADPRQKQDWFLRCLKGGEAHPLAACGLATLLMLSTGRCC